MILEIDNIMRAVSDIRTAVLSLEARQLTGSQSRGAAEITELTDKVVRQAKAMEIDITETMGKWLQRTLKNRP